MRCGIQGNGSTNLNFLPDLSSTFTLSSTPTPFQSPCPSCWLINKRLAAVFHFIDIVSLFGRGIDATGLQGISSRVPLTFHTPQQSQAHNAQTTPSQSSRLSPAYLLISSSCLLKVPHHRYIHSVTAHTIYPDLTCPELLPILDKRDTTSDIHRLPVSAPAPAPASFPWKPPGVHNRTSQDIK